MLWTLTDWGNDLVQQKKRLSVLITEVGFHSHEKGF